MRAAPLGRPVNAALVLAAGASTRLGTPKGLLRIRGEPAVARVARVAREAGCTDVVVVLGADAPRLRAVLPLGIRTVLNEAWAAGRTGTLKAGLRALDASADILVWPIDHPVVAPSTVATLLELDGDVRVPAFQGRRGHPTVFAASLRPELLALTDDQPLHDVVHADPRRVREVPVGDSGVVFDVDLPEDAARLEELYGRPSPARPLP